MRIARWWSLFPGVGTVVVGVMLQPPYPFDESQGSVTRCLFIIGGTTLALLPWLGVARRRWRSLVACFAAAAYATRAVALIFDHTSTIAWQNRVVGAVAWTVGGYLIAVIMVATWPAMHTRRNR